MDNFQRCVTARQALNAKGIRSVDLCVVLGTGLGGVTDEFEQIMTIPYKDIPGFPVSTVNSHKGNLIIAKNGITNVMFLQGRFHVYEGYTAQEVVIPVRTAALLGCKTLIVTNASGGVGEHLQVGDIMLIDDHINMSGENPLIGQNIDELGERFPVMNAAYDARLKEMAVIVAADMKIPLKKGVYVWLKGPSLETPAEYKMIKCIGGDTVGMSTVPEVIAARHAGLSVAGFSIITNKFEEQDVHANKGEFESVVSVANESGLKLAKLLKEFIKKLDMAV